MRVQLGIRAVYRNGGFRGAGERSDAYIFVTVMVATGLMSPESQKASNSPHAIIEMGWNGFSITSGVMNVMPASVPASGVGSFSVVALRVMSASGSQVYKRIPIYGVV